MEEKKNINIITRNYNEGNCKTKHNKLYHIKFQNTQNN